MECQCNFEAKLPNKIVKGFDSLSEARAWARLRLRSWMELGDRIVTEQSDNTWLEVVHDRSGQRTDSIAIISRVP